MEFNSGFKGLNLSAALTKFLIMNFIYFMTIVEQHYITQITLYCVRFLVFIVMFLKIQVFWTVEFCVTLSVGPAVSKKLCACVLEVKQSKNSLSPSTQRESQQQSVTTGHFQILAWSPSHITSNTSAACSPIFSVQTKL